MADTLPRVLHIEDNQDIATVVAQVLKSEADLVHVSSLQAAREKISGEKFDLAIVDLVLPDGSGLDIVAELKALSPPLPVIIHSAHEVADTTRNVDAVLFKTRTPHDEFRQTVRRLAAGEAQLESAAE